MTIQLNRSRATGAAVALAGALVLAACGGGDDETSIAPPPAPPAATPDGEDTAGTDTTGPNIETDTGTDADTSTDTGTDSGTDDATDAGTDTSTDTDADTGATPVAEVTWPADWQDLSEFNTVDTTGIDFEVYGVPGGSFATNGTLAVYPSALTGGASYEDLMAANGLDPSAITEQPSVQVDGRDAMAFEVERDAQGISIRQHLYALELEGGIVEIVFSASADSFDEHVGTFQEILDSATIS